jgi:hypothetical protein
MVGGSPPVRAPPCTGVLTSPACRTCASGSTVHRPLRSALRRIPAERGSAAGRIPVERVGDSVAPVTDDMTGPAIATTSGRAPAEVGPAGVQRVVPWAAVAVFAIVSCGLAWCVALPLWLRGMGMSDPLLPVIAVAMMLTPAIATVAALLVEGRQAGRRSIRVILRELGMWPLRPVGRTLGVTAAAIFAMPILIAAGLLLVGVFGLAAFDLVGFSGFSPHSTSSASPASPRSSGPGCPVAKSCRRSASRPSACSSPCSSS